MRTTAKASILIKYNFSLHSEYLPFYPQVNVTLTIIKETSPYYRDHFREAQLVKIQRSSDHWSQLIHLQHAPTLKAGEHNRRNGRKILRARESRKLLLDCLFLKKYTKRSEGGGSWGSGKGIMWSRYSVGKSLKSNKNSILKYILLRIS